MPFHLNEKLDAEALRQEYQKRSFIQIKEVLPAAEAGKLYTCLAKDTPWGLFYFKDTAGEKIPPERFEKMPMEKKQETYKYIFGTARSQYQFMFLYHPIMQNALSGKNPDHLLQKLFEFLNTAPVLDFVRKVTGIPEIMRADTMATRYIGNCFLQLRHDHQEGKSRRVAYVLNMTQNWRTDWGGQLQFFDDDFNVERSFKPTFNALNMFTVPKNHAVSFVPPYCPGERLSVAGWFHDAQGKSYGH